MIPLYALALVSQLAPPFPFPTQVTVKRGSQYSGTLTRTFSDPDQDLTLIQVDSFLATVSVPPTSNSPRWEWDALLKPKQETLDGETRTFDAKAPAMAIKETRSVLGAQLRFETALDEGNDQWLLSRFLTVPLPSKIPAIDGTWEFNDSRTMGYQFRGRYLGFENGAHKVKTFFKSAESPHYSANGTAWIAANGLPVKIDLTASPVQIPGGDENRVRCRIQFEFSQR